METSKDYYESVMRDFSQYGRGRTAEQYCRDEAVDYKWLMKSQDKFGTAEKSQPVKPTKRSKAKAPDIIQLHYEAEDAKVGEEQTAEQPQTTSIGSSPSGEWRVASLKGVTRLKQ